MGKFGILDPVDFTQKYRSKAYNVQDHLEEFSDDLDIPSIWFHGDDIQVGYSYTFPISSEKTDRILSPIVDAVMNQEDLVQAILQETSLYSSVSRFYKQARDKHVWGLMDTKDTIVTWLITQQEAIQLLSDYFEQPVENFSNVTTEYLHKSAPYFWIEDPKYYLLEFLEREVASFITNNGDVSDYSAPLYNAYTNTLDYSVMFGYATDQRFKYTSFWDSGLSIDDYDFHLEKISYLTNMDYQGIVWFIKLKAIHKINLSEIVFEDRLWQSGNQTSEYIEKFLFKFSVNGEQREFILSKVVPRFDEFKDRIVFDNTLLPDEEYLPVIPIIVGGEILNEEFSKTGFGNLYRDTEKLSQALKVDHALLREAVTNLDDYKKMFGAYMFFGANLFSSKKYELDYVMDYFNELIEDYLNNRPYYQEYMDWNNYVLEITQGTSVDEESANNTAFRHYLTIGKITKTVETIQFPYDYKKVPELSELELQDPKIREFYSVWFQPKIWIPGKQEYVAFDYRLQYLDFIGDNYAVIALVPVSELGNAQPPEYILCKRSGNTWVKLTIKNPVLLIQTGSANTQRLDPITIMELMKRDDTQFRIPLKKTIIERYNSQTKNKLIMQTMAINVIAIEKVYINWYATEEFQRFMLAVSIIVTIFTGIAYGIWEAVKATLIAVIASKVGAFVAKKIGGDLGVAIGFLTSVAIIYYGGGFTSTSGNTTFMEASVTNVSIATNALAKIHNIKIQEQMEKLQKEMRLFNKSYKEAMELIEEVKEELLAGSGIKYELSQLIDELDYIYETPADFLHRTTQIKNPGVLLLQEANTYVARHLQLPDYLSQNNVIE